MSDETTEEVKPVEKTEEPKPKKKKKKKKDEDVAPLLGVVLPPNL